MITSESHCKATAQGKSIAFALGQQVYALPLEAVREILPMAQLSRPPGMPSLLDGFLNLGGTSVAVVNLGRLFGLANQPWQLHSPLLVLRSQQAPLALAVERVLGIISLSADSFARLGDNCAGNDCAEGVAITAQGPVILLALERILLGRERICLAELQAAEQARLDALTTAAGESVEAAAAYRSALQEAAR